LDGVIQAPGGKKEDTDGNFGYGGWSIPYWHDDIGARFFKTMETSDTLLLGRKTWQIHSVFESMDDPFAKSLTQMPKFVVSKTLKNTDSWSNSTIISDNVVEEIKKLKIKNGKNILIDGSSVLLKSLIENKLIDTFQLHVYPLVLGNGKKLFHEGKKISLDLVESKMLPTGVQFLEYKLKNN
jgi:dihydrofolate reductase